MIRNREAVLGGRGACSLDIFPAHVGRGAGRDLGPFLELSEPLPAPRFQFPAFLGSGERLRGPVLGVKLIH